MLTSTQYFAAGTPQLAALSDEARANAARSLAANAPGVTASSRAAINSTLSATLPYFTVDANGAPVLTIPPPVTFPVPTPFDNGAPFPVALEPTPGAPGSAPPSSVGTPAPTTAAPGVNAHPEAITATPPPTLTPGATAGGPIITSGPCPSGYVTSGATPQPRTLEQQINDAFLAAPVTQTAAPFPCQINPVLAAQQLVTKDDLVQVLGVNAFDGDADLTIIVRTLGCDGQIITSQAALSLPHFDYNDATQGTVCIQLTDGYLLGVTVTGAPFCCTSGNLWVQGALVSHTCDGPASVTLFSDYLTDLQNIGWPGGRQTLWGEGPGTDYAFKFPIGVNQPKQFVSDSRRLYMVKTVSLTLQTSAQAYLRNLCVRFSPVIGPQQVYFGSVTVQPESTTYKYTWAAGPAVPYESVMNLVQMPLPPNLYLVDGEIITVVGNFDSGDRVLDGGVTYKQWARALS